MAAVVRVKPRHVAPVGYEWIDVCELVEDVLAGDLLQFTGVVNDNMTLMRKLPAGANAEPDGVALKDGFAGQRGLDYGIHCEMDGFSGLIPGALIYSSSAVAGGQDTTPNGATPAAAAPPVSYGLAGKAVRATRIRFQLR
jgi:hypothetical protein